MDKEKKDVNGTTVNDLRDILDTVIECIAGKTPMGLLDHLPLIKRTLEATITRRTSDINAGRTVGSNDFKEDCFALRSQIKETKFQTMQILHKHPIWDSENLMPEKHTAWEYAEMKANLMLAYRHLEDARMRFGKAIQAFDGGESCYKR